MITIEQVKAGLKKHNLELRTAKMIDDGCCCGLGAAILSESDKLLSSEELWSKSYEKYGDDFTNGFYKGFDRVPTLYVLDKQLQGYKNGLEIRNQCIEEGLL